MTEIISVRFKEGGKSYYFNPNGITVAVGESVIIETSRGIEFGECVESNRLIDEMELVSPLRPVVRKATEADHKMRRENQEKEKKAYDICQEKIQEHGLDMKLVEVEYNFDGSKILFFFTSEGRVDFRALVRDLAAIFHTRIELRQIGVRDEAKMLGGLGICGRPYCCNAFLDDFHPVSIKMAKTQNLSLNPTKISGACGRLMCCLKYEQEAYEDVLKRTPKLESLVETPDGVGTVNSVQLLREKVKVKLDEDPENPRVYSNDEITVIRSGKGKRPEGYELPEPQEKPRPKLRPVAPAAPVVEEKKQDKPEGTERPKRDRAKMKITPVVEEAPAEAKPQEENAPAAEKEKKSRRHRSRHKKPANPDGGEKKAESRVTPVKEVKEAPKPQKEKSGDGEAKAKKRRHHHHRRHPKGNGEGGAPKAE